MSHREKKTINDFGNQWLIHGSMKDDYWTSDEMFRDHFRNSEPPFSTLKGKLVLDVGSGSGRIIRMLARYNPESIVGVEPSQGFVVLKENVSDISNLKLINDTAENFSLQDKVDFAISLGVIHHIPNPIPALLNINANLKDDGLLAIWVYGYENNEFYVAIQNIFRPALRLLPDKILDLLSLSLTYLLDIYLLISKFMFKERLPMSTYLKSLFSRCGRLQKKYIVFDQLNPVHAKYYKKLEVVNIVEQAGFEIMDVFHRHEYSWTVIAKKKVIL